MLRSLTYFWRSNLAVVAGAAVATAVLAGALIVGDSVRGSLRSRTLERLGGVDRAILADRFLPASLVDRLESAGVDDRLAPVVALRASAVHSESRALAAGVRLWGVDERFGELFGGDAEGLQLERRSGQVFPPLVVNEALARELGAAVGDAVLVSFERRSVVPRATLLGSTDPEDVVGSVRFEIAAVIPDRGLGAFGLRTHQGQPFNAFASGVELDRALAADGGFNVLLAGGAGEGGEENLRAALDRVLAPEDLGLRLTPAKDHLSVESEEFVLRPALADAVQGVADELGLQTQPFLTHLANAFRVGDRQLPYSTVTALEVPAGEAFSQLVDGEGERLVALADDETILNAWAAEELVATVGDEVELTYYGVGAGDLLETRSASFRVAGVAALEGLAADRSLTPEFPGISDADRMGDWDPPFPVDLARVRPADEEYWEIYRGTPKAFVSLTAGQRLWSSRFGRLTAIRAARPASAAREVDLRFRRLLVDRLSPESAGLKVQPVKRQGLDAASGATDFSGLFLAFSVFLIVSAALLVGLLFRLAVQGRAAELGLRLALGYPKVRVKRRVLAEGAILAVAGASMGCLLAVSYAALLLRGMGSWWAQLIEASLLELHIRPMSLVGGGLGAVLLVLLVVWLTVRQLGRVPARVLLTGRSEAESAARRGTGLRLAAVLSTVLGLSLAGIAVATGRQTQPGLFFGVAAALLGAGLLFFAAWTRRPGGLGATGPGSLLRMAAQNSARSPGRSLLSVVLVATACFTLVALEAVRRDPRQLELGRDSGTGGYALVGESATPIHQNLNDPASLRELGLSGEALDDLGGLEIQPLRLVPGEDASCLNLYQPERPRLLGATSSFVARGGFRFRSATTEVDNPWTLLEQDLGPDVIPAIGDYTTVFWILHLDLGQDLVMEDEFGREVRLRIVALLDSSLFQSELLISEASLLRHFPSRGGYSFFLADAPPERASAALGGLETGLDRFGLDVTSAPEKLATYMAVDNIYLTTFQALGGLGLLLGTVGLAVVMVRNIVERRAELATLRAFGFRRSSLAWMVILENAFLLVSGLTIGTVAGLAAVAPHLLAGSAGVPWSSLLGTLGLILGVGLAAGAVAVVGALRVPLLPVLKAE